MHIPLSETPQRIRTDGTGGENLQGAGRREAIQDPSHRIIVTDLRWQGPAPESFQVLVGKALFSTIQGAAATERIQHKAEHHRTRINFHLGRDPLIDDVHQAHFVPLLRARFTQFQPIFR